MRPFEPRQAIRVRATVSRWGAVVSVALGLSLMPDDLRAGGFQAPEACQTYAGEAHLSCLYTYIGTQQERVGKVDEELKAQQGMLDHLRDQVTSQTPARDDMQRTLPDENETASPVPMPAASAVEAPPSFHSPQECRAYAGNAHLNCLYAYIEIQEGKMGKLEEELKAQRGMLVQLREQVDRQASVRDDLERRYAERQSTLPSSAGVYAAPPFYPGYQYPSPGLSLYFGAPGYYYGRPFFGPRFYGPGFYGPRLYGPRFFGGYRR